GSRPRGAERPSGWPRGSPASPRRSWGRWRPLRSLLGALLILRPDRHHAGGHQHGEHVGDLRPLYRRPLSVDLHWAALGAGQLEFLARATEGAVENRNGRLHACPLILP